MSVGHWKPNIYWEPTHQYLNWGSNHHMEHKQSVVHILLRRAEAVVSYPLDREEEVKHVKKALTANRSPKWFRDPQEGEGRRSPRIQGKFPLTIPHISRVLEQLQWVLRPHGVPSFNKPVSTLRFMLVSPKDKTWREKQCVVPYSVKSGAREKEYIKETARTVGVRFK